MREGYFGFHEDSFACTDTAEEEYTDGLEGIIA
jgi:hypothetical protein